MSAPGNDVVERARSRLGTVLRGKYRLDRILGVGGMASVFAATHLRNANRVAVKILHSELAIDPGLRARFLREGYAANSVEHSGTVRILDDDTDEEGAIFLVMGLLDGETLEARWLRAGRRLGAREVARMVYELLDVLAAAHAKGVIHRDIKPENLFLTHEGVLKVLDFGVARLLEGSGTTTRSGSILGTPAFMAPEQVLGRTQAVDAQSDVWGVGATAFTLLSGRHVHDAQTPEEMLVFTGSRRARSLASVAPDVPLPVVGVIDRALLFEKHERWPGALAMQGAMAQAYRDAFGEPVSRASAPEIAQDDTLLTSGQRLGELAESTESPTERSSIDVTFPSDEPTAPMPFATDPSLPMRPSTNGGVASSHRLPAPTPARALVLAASVVLTLAGAVGAIVVLSASRRTGPTLGAVPMSASFPARDFPAAAPAQSTVTEQAPAVSLAMPPEIPATTTRATPRTTPDAGSSVLPPVKQGAPRPIPTGYREAPY